MNWKESILNWVNDYLADKPELFLVELIVKTNGPNVTRVLVLIDSDQGLTIDNCSRLSRALSNWLDEQPGLDEPYMLDVSSPGVDFPLALPRQYSKNVGRRLKVTLNDASQLEGKLAAATAQEITLEVDKKEKGKKATVEVVNLPLAHIKKAHVLISFK